MLFSSSIFIYIFLPCSLLGYQLLSRFGRNTLLTWLTLVSLVFYGYWNPVYLLLLGASILMNFLFSQLLGGQRSESSQSRWLIFAIVSNISLLVYYKYLFPILNFAHSYHLAGHRFIEPVLPLGISFFTFTQIAYLIDLRQMIAKRQTLIPYSVFVTFFPHLIAGPIIHPRELMPQLDEGRIGALRASDVALGLSWFILGLAKKVLIADRIAPLADVLYGHAKQAGFSVAWLGVLAYAMQLYFDFSGYSDMALALARMFSLEFPINFNSPFKAECIIEFWQRWHMTLSRYLNEYLYTPMLLWVNGRRMDAGKKANRKAAATPEGFVSMVAFPTITTMFIAGVWHGAGIQFLVFGLLHGVYLSINHAWRLLTPKGSRFHRVLPVPFTVLLTFLCVLVGMIFFRANDVHDALYIISTLGGMHGAGTPFAQFSYLSEIPSISKFLTHIGTAAGALAICFFIVWAFPNTQEILAQVPKGSMPARSLLPYLKWRVSFAWSACLAMLFCAVLLLLDSSTRFLYFQF